MGWRALLNLALCSAVQWIILSLTVLLAPGTQCSMLLMAVVMRRDLPYLHIFMFFIIFSPTLFLIRTLKIPKAQNSRTGQDKNTQHVGVYNKFIAFPYFPSIFRTHSWKNNFKQILSHARKPPSYIQISSTKITGEGIWGGQAMLPLATVFRLLQ